MKLKNSGVELVTEDTGHFHRIEDGWIVSPSIGDGSGVEESVGQENPDV